LIIPWPDLPARDLPELFWLAPANGGDAEEDPEPNDIEREPRRRRALIVEDEIFIALHLETVLQDLGLEVSAIVATGAEAVATAIRTEPDMIFMDINLRGDIDGVEAARQALAVLDVPVIFVTAYGDEATLARIAAVAPNAPVLQKPPQTATLAAAIMKVGRT
jgi:CheY-like chemotaxis protein